MIISKEKSILSTQLKKKKKTLPLIIIDYYLLVYILNVVIFVLKLLRIVW